MKKVTIQGVAGCYHDAAAHLYFNGEEIQTVACETFPAMFETLANDASLFGIMAIENTIAGSLLQNHELLRQSNLSIIGELKLRISHVIASLPGQTIDELSEVNSHPMALMQCEQFLRRHPNLKIVERLDTAGSAKEIAEGNLTGHAAVCGEYAANLYGLNILEKRDRDQQTQLHPIPYSGRSAARSRIRPCGKRHQQSLDRIHHPPHTRSAVENSDHTLVFRYQSLQNTVDTYNRPRVGIPVLC